MLPVSATTWILVFIGASDLWCTCIEAQHGFFTSSTSSARNRFSNQRRRHVSIEERTDDNDGHRNVHQDVPSSGQPKSFRFRHFHGDPVVVYGDPVAPKGPQLQPVLGSSRGASLPIENGFRAPSNTSSAPNRYKMPPFFPHQTIPNSNIHEAAMLAGCRDLNQKLREQLSFMGREIKDLESQLLLVRRVQKLIESQQAAASTTTQACQQSLSSAAAPSAPKRWLSHPTIIFKLLQVILGVILMVLQRKYHIVPSLTDQDAILLVQITYAAFLIITPPLLLSYLTSSATSHRPMLHGSLAEVIYLLVGAIMFITCGASFIHNWIDFKPSDFDAGLIDKLPLDAVPPLIPLPFDPREVKSDLKRYREAALALGGLSIANGIFYFLDSWIVVYYMKSVFA